jgi:ABC-type glycerol-3-phosphate transport system substrate-binding protein
MHHLFILRKIKKTAIAVFSLLLCLALLIGCTEKILVEPGAKDVIYKFATFAPEGETYDILVGVAYDSDYVYMLTQKTEAGEDGTVENFYLLKTDTAGNIIEKQLLSSATEEEMASAGYSYYMGISVGKDGEVYLIKQTALNTARPKSEITTFVTSEDGTVVLDESNEQTEEEEPKTKTELVRRSGETETVVTDISEKIETLGVDTSQMYISDFEVDKKGFAYITVGMDSVYALDISTGEIVFENKPLPQGGNIKGFYKNDKGEICVVSFKKMAENDETINKLIITPINPKTGDFGKEEIIDAPGGDNSNLAPGNDNFDYYGFTAVKIFGYRKDNKILVADLPASGVNLSEVTRVMPISDTQFLITGYTTDTIGLEKLYSLTKVDPKDVPDKSIVTVAAIGEPLYFDEYISEFMLTHPQYQVEYKQYAIDSNASLNQALTAFNNDIIAGNIPDVIMIEPEMPYGNYVSKGMLADLYTLIDKDPDYSREDFLQPILSAFETDDKLYSIAPTFMIVTLVGKTEVFGEAQGQSFTELQAAAANIPGASLFGTGFDRDAFTRVITRAARGFIDDEKGKCNFESEEFISLLEYAKSLPAPSPDADPYQFNFNPGETTDYSKDRTLIELLNIYDFRHIVSLEKVEFGEPVTFLGFPNNSGGSGILIDPTLETAITAKAKNPDGAWEFVKGLFAYGNPFIKNMGYPPLVYFPTLMTELNIAAEKATIPPYETWYGERMPRANWIGANLSNQPDNTISDNEKMFDLFDSIDGVYRKDPAITEIISEETAVYFASNKSAAETAKIIQNRVTTYIEETK